METERGKILMVDNSSESPSELSARLQQEGYFVVSATNKREGLKMAHAYGFDLILVDSVRPGCDDFIVCREFRQAGIVTPILVLTHRIEADKKLLAIRLGADDYVTKPFEVAELLVRMQIMVERARFRSLEISGHVGTIKVDVRHRRLTRDGNPVSITSREFRLLQYLMKRSGTCVSRGELLQAVWGYVSSSTTRTVDVHIASLRKKLEPNPKTPKLIRTIPKVGYMFVNVSGIRGKLRRPSGCAGIPTAALSGSDRDEQAGAPLF